MPETRVPGSIGYVWTLDRFIPCVSWSGPSACIPVIELSIWNWFVSTCALWLWALVRDTLSICFKLAELSNVAELTVCWCRIDDWLFIEAWRNESLSSGTSVTSEFRALFDTFLRLRATAWAGWNGPYRWLVFIGRLTSLSAETELCLECYIFTWYLIMRIIFLERSNQ